MDGITPITSEILADMPKPAKKAEAKKAKPAKKAKVAERKPASKSKPKPKAKKAAAVVARPARLDLRLTKAEKAKLTALAKKKRRTVTSVVQELIEKMK